MQVLRKQSFTILCYVIAENHTQRIIGVSSSPKRRLPATLSSIVMAFPPISLETIHRGALGESKQTLPKLFLTKTGTI